MVNKKTDPSLYWYLCGREDLLEGDAEYGEIDISALVEQVQMPDDVAKLCQEAARNALGGKDASRDKREWLADNADEIVGINKDLAWDLYLRGQTDELADMLATEVYEGLREQLEHDGDDGAKDEDPEDGGTEEDDEDGADGEDEDDEDGEDELDEEP